MNDGDIKLSLEKALKAKRHRIKVNSNVRGLEWKPDILTSHGSNTLAFLIRRTRDVPDGLIQRIASTRPRRKGFLIYVVFTVEPKVAATNSLRLYGIGVQVFQNGKLSTHEPAKEFIPKSSLKIQKADAVKMGKTDVFISSQQDIPERKAAKQVIEDIKQTFPLYAFQVEDDPKFGGSKAQTRRCIDKGLQKCEWFVAILADEQRYWVNYEVRNAIEHAFKKADVIVYVKAKKKCHEAWRALLDWIQGTEIKYLPYTSVKDLRKKLNLNLLGRIERIHNKLGLKMYN